MSERRARTGLVWRLYAVGVVQFLLVALSALLIGFVVTRLARWDMQTLIARLKPLANDRAALVRELQSLNSSDRLQVSIYDDENHLVASNVEPALRAPRFGGRATPPSLNDDRPPPSGPPRGMPPDLLGPLLGPPPHFGGPGDAPHPPDNFARFELNGHEGLIVARFPHRGPGSLPPLLTLFFGLIVLGAGALLTARWIARPLSQLSRMANSLGRGDLSARSELTRSDEVGEVARAFDEMAERIQKLLQTEKELLANVAHELRTPLARIRVALEIASEGDAETARVSLGEIAVDLAELESLVDDVLTAARFELTESTSTGASLPLHREPIAAKIVAARAAERFRVRHPDRPFDTHFAVDAGTIEADPMLVRRVLDNLLENAHKYSPDPHAQIALSVFEQGERACFVVTDHGMGIPEEDLPRVFSAFFRSEKSRSRGTGGVGLGLTLAQRIVEAHGGSIEVSSKLGEGSTFRACLPLCADTPPSSGSSLAAKRVA